MSRVILLYEKHIGSSYSLPHPEHAINAHHLKCDLSSKCSLLLHTKCLYTLKPLLLLKQLEQREHFTLHFDVRLY